MCCPRADVVQRNCRQCGALDIVDFDVCLETYAIIVKEVGVIIVPI
jgi:hypothetical protein